MVGLALALSAIILCPIGLWMVYRAVVGHAKARERCYVCGFDLQGSRSERVCPECGAVIVKIGTRPPITVKQRAGYMAMACVLLTPGATLAPWILDLPVVARLLPEFETARRLARTKPSEMSFETLILARDAIREYAAGGGSDRLMAAAVHATLVRLTENNTRYPLGDEPVVITGRTGNEALDALAAALSDQTMGEARFDALLTATLGRMRALPLTLSSEIDEVLGQMLAGHPIEHFGERGDTTRSVRDPTVEQRDRIADTMLAIQGDPSRKWNQHWGVALEYTSKAGRIDAERMGRYLEQSLNPRVTFIEPGPLHQGDFVEFVVDPQWKLGAGLPVFMTARPVNSEWTGRVFGGVRCGLVAPARIDPQHFVRGQIALPDAPGVHHLELEVVMRIGRDIEQSELHGRTSEDDQAEAELWRALPERTVTRRVRVKLDLAASATPRVKMSPNGVDAGTIAQGIGKPWVRCDATVQPPRVAIRFFPQKMAMPMSARVSVRQSGREQDIGWMLASPHFQRSLAVEGDALGIDVHQPFEVVLQSDAGPLERPYWFTTVWEGEVLFPIERPVHAALPGEFARESVKVIP